MLRGRIMSANGIKADDLKAAAERRLGAAKRPRHHLSRPRCRAARAWSRATGGAPTTKGPPLVSFEKKIADGLGLKVGDPVVVNVLGRNIDGAHRQPARRRLGKSSASISCWCSRPAPSPARRTPTSPRSPIRAAARVAQEIALLKAVSDAFPAVTAVRVQGCDRGGRRASCATWCSAVRGASCVALIAAMLVLGGALAAGHSYRVYDAVVLKTLGATRGKLIAAYALEYLLLGAATALFGVAAGSIAAWLVVTARDESHVRLAAGPGGGCGIWRAACHGGVRPDRHVHGARP